MKFGMDALVSISEKLLNRGLKYGDSVIIGENSCGKSLLLRLLVQKAGKTDSIYFLDAVNRGFDVGKVVRETKKPAYKRTIIDTRIQDDFFNLKDSFNCFGTMTERIEQIYYPYEEKLQDLFEKLTDERFRLIPGDVFGEVEFKEGRGLLSSGYQAIVRILLELLYFQDKCVEEKGIERAVVIIDELDEFLSPGYAYKIFPFLKEQFPQMDFIVTTHSGDLVAGAQNANLIVLDEKGYEVMDINDCQSISEVQIIFDRVFGGHMPQASETENILRRLFNNKINQAWTEGDQRQLEHAIEKSNSDKLVECVPNIGLACSDCNSSFKRRGEAQRNKNMRGEVLKQFEEKSRCSVKRRKQCTVPCKALRKLQESYNKLPGGEIILQPMGAKGEQSGEPLALQYNVLKMEFQPNTNQYTYSKEELSFIQKHIQRFHLNDPQYRTHQLADFLKIIIDGGGMIPQYEYNNLVVKLFADKIREKTKEERVDICSRIYVAVFLKI